MKNIFVYIFKAVKSVIKSILIFLFFPIYGFFRTVNPKEIATVVNNPSTRKWKVVLRRTLSLVFVILFIFPLWGAGYYLGQRIIFQKLGFSKERILIAGTGSMYPTFPKGEGKTPEELSREIASSPGMFPYPNGFVFRGKRYFGYELERGDIVVIENEEIRKLTEQIYGDPSGWVKRIIGLPGDTIELKNGLVYLNKVAQKESYTAEAHSTFGESFLDECKVVTVPDNSIFVMGDNRKGSGDSREIGFITIDSVNHVLPFSAQLGEYDKNWRDTTLDLSDSTKIKLNKTEYLKLLNAKRKDTGANELEYQPKLENSAIKRATVMLQYDDFSYEATSSGYTMEMAMSDSNYSNIVWGESPSQGYYEAQELLENQLEFPNSKKFLLDPDFDELGIAEVEGEINECPTQAIVLHLAGYVPPNYKQADIDAWKNVLLKLKEVQPSWVKLKEYSDFYNQNKADIDRINEIITIRITNITKIISRMEANEWLTKSEEEIAANDKQFSKEEGEIANKINTAVEDFVKKNIN